MDAAIAIFGAAVRADGRPSQALRRRIGYALTAAEACPGAPIFCSGAAGRAGPSEASVMAATLCDRGVGRERLVLDEASRDTLQSVLAVTEFLKARGLARCIVCSDAYHLPRIRLMLALLGVRTEAGPALRGPAGSMPYWLRMVAREALAIPYDAALVLAKRRRFLARI